MSYHYYAAIYSIDLLVPNMRVARMFPVSLPVCVNSVVIGLGGSASETFFFKVLERKLTRKA